VRGSAQLCARAARRAPSSADRGPPGCTPEHRWPEACI
jgi:hypothetical protein